MNNFLPFQLNNESVWLIVVAIAGIFTGGGIVWLIGTLKISATRQQLESARQDLINTRSEIDKKNEEISTLKQSLIRLETTIEFERKATNEKIAILNDAAVKMRDAFSALSNEALKNNNQSFLELAKATLEKFQAEAKGDLELRQKAVENLVAPIKQSMEKVDVQIKELEKVRQQAYGGLTEQIKSMISTQEKLQSETGNLVKALRMPTVRGHWGEIQLKRVVEIAGMLEYCDFFQQQSVTTDEGRLRPDLLVKLPGGKNIVVDAKAPLQAYLDAIESENEEMRLLKLREHARLVRSHITKLSEKSYWDQFQPTPEFVILFLPGETFFSVASEQYPALIEEGVKQRVILATPTTLIALLRAVHYGWRQEQLAENSQRISDLGQELHERIATMVEHLARLGNSLGKTVESFNSAVASFEGRVLSSARKFKTLGAGSKKEIENISPLEKNTRHLSEIQKENHHS
ncbi:MAG: DNA recombination protein RmuC [Candidatus Kuenenia sp.]|nr:DNA recombination protein RmuC [Candidatus Kuenenia hertensis]